MTNFTHSELQRYARQFSLPQIGLEGQQRLKNMSVLCVGAGGIGSPVLAYLAAAGIGKIGIIDDDRIELSNLQRQILYTTEECGEPKVTVAKNRLLNLNDTIELSTHPTKLTRDNALEIIPNYQIVIDGSDNYATRYLVNDACQVKRVNLISASLFQFGGQLLAFEFGQSNTACYRCLYPAPLAANFTQNCVEAGVVGAVAGILGTMAATAAIKLACGMQTGLQNQLLVFDGLDFDLKKYRFDKDPHCVLCSGEITFQQLPHFEKAMCVTSSEITQEQLHNYLDQKKRILIVDVRNEQERAKGCIPVSHHFPFDELEKLTEIPADFHNYDAIVLYCTLGIRSSKAVKFLQQKGLQNVFSLKGGFDKTRAMCNNHPQFI